MRKWLRISKTNDIIITVNGVDMYVVMGIDNYETAVDKFGK